MAQFNNGFPVTYPQMFYPPYQAPVYQAQQPQQQTYSLPTIRAEIVQVDSEQAANDYPVAAGASQMMISRDEKMIFVKSANANGYVLDIYEKRPPAPPPPKFNPNDYVRKDEIEKLVAAAVAAEYVPEREEK